MQVFLYYDKKIHSNMITNIGTDLTNNGLRSQMVIITNSLYREKTFQTIAGTKIQYKTTFIDKFGSNVIFDLYSVYYFGDGSFQVGGNLYNRCSKEKYLGLVETQKIISGTGLYANVEGDVTVHSNDSCRTLEINMLKTNINM